MKFLYRVGLSRPAERRAYGYGNRSQGDGKADPPQKLIILTSPGLRNSCHTKLGGKRRKKNTTSYAHTYNWGCGCVQNEPSIFTLMNTK